MRRIVPALSTLCFLGALQNSAMAQSSAKADASVPRDKNGRIQRSEKSTGEFKKQTGYPQGRSGYVIDHIVPLAKGGRDAPSNMQWQTKEAAKAKDKWERGQTPSARAPRATSGSTSPNARFPRAGFGQSSRSPAS